ncbi:hypothetical protein [Actinoplanes sp. NPDC026619]|uniref:hypothetical protein n=1 Tax=Actinoplanes sp. NPDC026619 TaxID=3155798 RepID=UPI0033E4757C
MGRTIAVLLEDAALHRVVEDQGRKLGFQVRDGGEDEAFDGLITDGYRPKRLPAVFVDRAADDADAVVSTNVAGAASAIRHLVSHGHTRAIFAARSLISRRRAVRAHRRLRRTATRDQDPDDPDPARQR